MDDRARCLLARLLDDAKAILGENLAGFYVHGSLAFGCFRWEASDVDFLIVVHRPMALAARTALARAMLDASRDAPPKGLEMSVVLEEACRNFRHPAPYELHFSKTHLARCARDPEGYCRGMHGVDPDLAAHFAVTRQVGVTLFGPPAEEMFAPVPREAVLDSVLSDVRDANLLGNPVYAILNLCRVRAFEQEGWMLSKRGGGEWMLPRLDGEDRSALASILSAYERGTPLPEEDRIQALGERLRGEVFSQT